MPISIRPAGAHDVAACVGLAEVRRDQYQAYEPRFWRKSARAAEMSGLWFTHLFAKPDVVALVAVEDDVVQGFIIGAEQPAPPVYDPGGRTALIDDFVVSEGGRWGDVGAALLAACREAFRARGFAQVVVVGARQDAPKTEFLEASGLSLASTWWTAEV